ncbi:MAG: S-layer protein [Candidatus Diapherotrites archaeon]|nr:S-layer protein [Candidatus Diapherotrites archaeon]
MRSINVKRLVSAGVGAALLGATAATAFAQVDAGLNKSFFYKDSMEPNAVVVVGADAAASDAVVAGNIAATIANLAYSEISVDVSATGDVDVGEVTVGEPTVSDKLVNLSTEADEEIVVDGKTYDADSNDFDGSGVEFDTVTADSSDFDGLKKVTDYEYTVDYDDDGSDTDFEMDIEETIEVVEADVVYDADEDIQNLAMEIGKNDIVYTLEFSQDGLVSFDEDSDDVTDVEIPFLGETYIVTEVDVENATVELVKTKQANHMAVGQTIEVEGYSLEIVDIQPSYVGGSDDVHLSLTQGDTVVALEVVAEGSDTDFDGVLTGKVRVDTAFAGVIERNSYVNIMLDTESLTLEDGETFELDEDWEVAIETTFVDDDDPEGDTIDSISLSNEDISWSSDEEKLLWNVSDRTKAVLPNDFAEVVFKGLESEDTEDIRVSENLLEFSDGEDDYAVAFFAVESGSSGTLDFGNTSFEYELVESDDNASEFFLYVDVEGNGLESNYAFDNDTVDDFDDVEDDDVRLGTESLNGTATWADSDNTPFDASTGVSIWTVDFDGNGEAEDSGDLELVYTLVWDGENSDLYGYIYDVDVDSEYGVTFDFESDLNVTDVFNEGDYTEEAADAWGEIGFVPMVDDVDTTDPINANRLVIKETAADGDEETFTVRLDPVDGALIAEDGDDYANDSYTVGLDVGSNLSTDDNELKYITSFGTIATLDSGSDDFAISVPDTQRIAQMAIGMESTTEGGQAITTLAEGESTTIGGVTVTVSGIDVSVASGAVSGGEATGACVAVPSTYTQTTVQSVDTLVFVDNQTLRAGNVVLVGGPIVNDLTAELGSATELGIASAGQKVVALKGNKLLVAGNTADDTVQAGAELINWLKANI